MAPSPNGTRDRSSGARRKRARAPAPSAGSKAAGSSFTLRVARPATGPRLSRLEQSIGADARPVKWTVYALDDESNEYVYAERRTEEEHKAWKATDPRWADVQRSIFQRLFENPATRDWMLKQAIVDAVDRGDLLAARDYALMLSPETRQRYGLDRLGGRV